MKAISTVFAALAIALASPVFAADHMDHGAMHPPGSSAAMVDGLVKKVDKAGGKLTVAHGPLPNGMPAMTMAFKVKNPAWLDQVQAGQKIHFAIDDSGMTIVRLDVAK